VKVSKCLQQLPGLPNREISDRHTTLTSELETSFMISVFLRLNLIKSAAADFIISKIGWFSKQQISCRNKTKQLVEGITATADGW
jgi:hypothetical protein